MRRFPQIVTLVLCSAAIAPSSAGIAPSSAAPGPTPAVITPSSAAGLPGAGSTRVPAGPVGLTVTPREETHPTTGQRVPSPASTGRHRGVGWVALDDVDASQFQPLVEHHVDWIAQTPFGWQQAIDEPELRLVTSGRVLWGETDEGLRVTTDLARRRGIETLLKPHVWVRGGWRGDIEMGSDADWEAWFSDYRRFILHYARFAQEQGIPVLCIGTELHRTVLARPDRWEGIIAEIRAVYDGHLTYGANWYREFQEVPFWDELDFIGIQAYFPLSEAPDPSLEELLDGWRPWFEAIREVQRRHDKPVLFTEAGYRSWDRAAATPWEWPQRGGEAVDLELQERLYEALFRTFWNQDWFAGVYWWKWYPPGGPGPENSDFTPQDKPAAGVLARWFDGPGE